MTGPLAPQTFAGLKRRTRVTMGRCQGFYCSADARRDDARPARASDDETADAG